MGRAGNILVFLGLFFRKEDQILTLYFTTDKLVVAIRGSGYLLFKSGMCRIYCMPRYVNNGYNALCEPPDAATAAAMRACHVVFNIYDGNMYIRLQEKYFFC